MKKTSSNANSVPENRGKPKSSGSLSSNSKSVKKSTEGISEVII